MEVYCEKLFRGYLDRSPVYTIPQSNEVPSPIDDVKPLVTGIALHEHGSELALVLEGKSFWFSTRLSIHGESVDTHASKISGSAIKLNFDKNTKLKLESLTNGDMVTVKIFNPFSTKPTESPKIKVVKKVSFCFVFIV